MTRKKIYVVAATMLAGVPMLVSCDDVKEEDRYINGGDITAERAVLLEDFTGQMCLNCPDAHEVIGQLEEQYGSDKVIAVSIHCGSFGLPTAITDFSSNTVGLMTAEGEAILQAYGIQSQPMGVINMGTPCKYDQWATKVRDAIQTVTNVTVSSQARYSATDRDGKDGYFGTIEIESKILSSETHQANIQYWIVEDGIVAMQRRGSQMISDYVHDNVFRAQVFPGIKGESLELSANIEKNVTGSIGTRWSAIEHWEVKNLSVVTIVSDKSGVLQVSRVPVELTTDETI